MNWSGHESGPAPGLLRPTLVLPRDRQAETDSDPQGKHSAGRAAQDDRPPGLAHQAPPLQRHWRVDGHVKRRGGA